MSRKVVEYNIHDDSKIVDTIRGKITRAHIKYDPYQKAYFIEIGGHMIGSGSRKIQRSREIVRSVNLYKTRESVKRVAIKQLNEIEEEMEILKHDPQNKLYYQLRLEKLLKY